MCVFGENCEGGETGLSSKWLCFGKNAGLLTFFGAATDLTFHEF